MITYYPWNSHCFKLAFSQETDWNRSFLMCNVDITNVSLKDKTWQIWTQQLKTFVTTKKDKNKVFTIWSSAVDGVFFFFWQNLGLEGQLEQWLRTATHSGALLAVPSLAVIWETTERTGTPREPNDLKMNLSHYNKSAEKQLWSIPKDVAS